MKERITKLTEETEKLKGGQLPASVRLPVNSFEATAYDQPFVMPIDAGIPSGGMGYRKGGLDFAMVAQNNNGKPVDYRAVKEHAFRYNAYIDHHVDLEIAEIHLKHVQKEASFDSFKVACSDLLEGHGRRH